jgi:transmembrane sensor
MGIDKHLVDRYMNGTASAEEAEQVLDWFQTKEGQEYLVNQFEHDLSEVDAYCKVSSEGLQTLKNVNKRIDILRVGRRNKRFYKNSSVWAVAACIALLVAVVSVWEMQIGFEGDEDEPGILVYTTQTSEHRLITLSDGSRVRLNEDSEIELPEYFQPDIRSVKISGEAFFEISPDETRPFIVNADNAEVQVLGTAFMIRTASHSGQTMVAVRDGKISFGAAGKEAGKHQTLERNMIGFYNEETASVTIENLSVTNYLTWMHGRVIFERTPFREVLKQLQHIYGLNHTVEDQAIYNLTLTADFSERSTDNVLETIAHSLGINAEKDGNSVWWSLRED